MTGITAQQAKLLAFIEECQAKGFTPSYDEMGEHLGLKSKSGIVVLIDELESRGKVRRLARRARSIEIIRNKCPHCGGQL